jgi:hypothetical protein
MAFKGNSPDKKKVFPPENMRAADAPPVYLLSTPAPERGPYAYDIKYSDVVPEGYVCSSSPTFNQAAADEADFATLMPPPFSIPAARTKTHGIPVSAAIREQMAKQRGVAASEPFFAAMKSAATLGAGPDSQLSNPDCELIT